MSIEQNPESKTYQVPHGGEPVFREFDKTPLDKAPLDMQPHEVTDTSVLPEALQIPPLPTKEALPWYKKRIVKVGGAVAGLIAVAGAGVGINAGGEKNTETRQEPSVSASTNPSETEAPESNTSEFEPVELTVENYQDGDQLARALNSEYNKWVMSGVDLEGTVDWADPEGSISAIAEKYDDKYIDALFVSDWQDRPQLREMIDGLKDQHGIVLNASIMTTDSTKPEDIEPYKQGTDVTMTRVDQSTADLMIVSSRHIMWSNADKNRGDLYIDNVNGREGGETVTFVNQDGVWKISDIKYFAG